MPEWLKIPSDGTNLAVGWQVDQKQHLSLKNSCSEGDKAPHHTSEIQQGTLALAFWMMGICPSEAHIKCDLVGFVKKI